MQVEYVVIEEEEEEEDIKAVSIVKVVRGIKPIRRSTNDFRRNV